MDLKPIVFHSRLKENEARKKDFDYMCTKFSKKEFSQFELGPHTNISLNGLAMKYLWETRQKKLTKSKSVKNDST